MEARQKFARSAMGGFREEGMGGSAGNTKNASRMNRPEEVRLSEP